LTIEKIKIKIISHDRIPLSLTCTEANNPESSPINIFLDQTISHLDNDELRLSVRIYLKEKEKAIDHIKLSSTIFSFFFVLFADGKHKSTVLMICW
jgi:hypothetical protein